LQVVDAKPKGEMFTAACDIRNILTEIIARRGMEWREKERERERERER
jgi:hypothetical protein